MFMLKASVAKNLKREQKENQITKTPSTWYKADTQFLLWEQLAVSSVY